MHDRFLSPDERAERDHLFVMAGIDSQTQGARPNDEIKDNMVVALRDADQAGRTWAHWILEDALRDGLLKAWKNWDALHNRQHLVVDGVSHTVASRRGTRQRTEDGQVVHQRRQIALQTREELEEGLDGCDARMDAEQINRELYLRALKLMDRAPEASTPQEAADMLDEDLDEYLAAEGS